MEGLKKIFCFAWHNSPKRTIIRTIGIDVIHHHRDVSAFPLALLFTASPLHNPRQPFLFFFCILAGGMVFTVVGIRLGPFRFKGFLGCILGVGSMRSFVWTGASHGDTAFLFLMMLRFCVDDRASVEITHNSLNKKTWKIILIKSTFNGALLH